MLIVASFEVSMATQMDDSSPHTFIRPGHRPGFDKAFF